MREELFNELIESIKEGAIILRNKKYIRLLFDGGLRGRNDGTSLGYGSFKIYGRQEELIVHNIVDFNIPMTNNQAEYATLNDALKYICDLYNPNEIYLVIQGDSNLVRNQIGSKTEEGWQGWRCNNSALETYRDLIRFKLDTFYMWCYRYINEKEVKKILGH